MNIVVIGLNHRTAPLELRERLTFQEQDLAPALHKLVNSKSVLEIVVVGTCNRTEIYAVVDQRKKRLDLHHFLESWFGVPAAVLLGHLYAYEDQQAVAHLFKVTCGLDSMVIGETQILGQVRHAFLLAQQEKVTGTIFNALFKQAITLAKKAHLETSIADNPVSVSYAAVELGKRIFGQYKNKKVMIIGAGEMGELTLKHLHALGANEIFVVNRTFEKAVELAARFGGVARSFTQLEETVSCVDVVISSTDARGTILCRSQLEDLLKKRKSRPLFMIDIAVPRDLDSDIGELANVFLYNIDDLQNIVESNLEERNKQALRIERMITEEVAAYERWYKTLGVGPLIQALQEKTTVIYEETMESLFRKLPELDEHERKVIRKLTKSIANQILRDPILRVKEMSIGHHGDTSLEMFANFFALQDQLAGAKEDEPAGIAKFQQVEKFEEPIVPSRLAFPIIP